jgi:hypothetical protein
MVLSDIMSSGFFQVIKRAFGAETPMHPVDRQMARRWIKQRLVTVFPELRNNPRALEEAYQSLSLSPRPGQEEGEAETVFEMSAPELR